MTIQDIEKIALFSMELDIREDYMREIEKKQQDSNNLTGPIHYCNFLFLLTRLFEPSLTVELGTLHGTSTEHLAEAEQVITIDPWQGSGQWIRSNNIIQRFEDSLSCNPRDWPRINLLFMDSVHTYEHCSKEWIHFIPFLHPKYNIVLIDDIHLSPEMDRFWNEISSPKVDLSFLHCGPGFGACIIP